MGKDNEPKVHEAEVVETTQTQALVMRGESNPSLAVMTAKEMRGQMKVESQKREILTEYITKHFKEGVDYGRIHVMSKDKCSIPYNCTNPKHFSKPTLFKAGAEKFLSLFRLRVEYSKDTETWEMLGNESKTVCYIARLYTANNVMAGEGRGVCATSEKSGSANTAVKIAQKRAKIDAVLSSGGLSDFFTQDLDEEAYKDGKFDAKLDAPAVTTPPKKLEDLVLESIRRAKTVSTLIDIDEKSRDSDKLTDAAKKKISKLVAEKVSEIENVDQSKGS